VERVHRRCHDTKAIAMADIVNYIDRWYNAKRRHSSIGMQSPQSFLKQWRTAV
jgi:putative transposase